MDAHFKPEHYHRPTDLETASTLLAQRGARVIAGGTDLLVNGPADTKSLVDINGLGLRYIREEEGLRIGVTSTFADLLRSPLLASYPYHVISDVSGELGHHNLRHVATIGGNICNAVPSADTPIALIALDAEAVIHGPSGERTVPLDGFFKFVRETVLAEGEFLKEIAVPVQPEAGASFQKLGRTKVDIALVNAACRISIVEGLVSDSRIVLGAVYPTPLRIRAAEDVLNGNEFTVDLAKEAAQVAAEATKPISDHRASAEYRREISGVLVKRAIIEANGRAEGLR
jgi:carbon-monoxide dehydrogenase medium subunit